MRLVSLPLSSLSKTVCSPFSKDMASAGLWNVRPNFRSSTRQWWKMGFTLLYTNPLCTAHSNTGYRHRRQSIHLQQRHTSPWNHAPGWDGNTVLRWCWGAAWYQRLPWHTHTLTARSRSRSPRMMYSLRPLPSWLRPLHMTTWLRPPPPRGTQPPLESSRVITTARTRTLSVEITDTLADSTTQS